MTYSGAPDTLSPAPVADPSLIGKVISGKYQVTALIGRGGMGRVYRAEQIPLGRIVALKTLATGTLRRPEGATPTGMRFKERFFREASVLSRLQHANVVTVFDYGRIEGVSASDDEYYMAMEFLVGETLQDRLNARGRFPADEAIHYVRQAAQGLSAAHAMDVVHRDLKPSNLMIMKGPVEENEWGVLKILDFGIIKILDGDSQDVTQEGALVGSPRYMAPEQIVAGTVDIRADIYALGVIAYQLLTGQPPFNGETAVQTMMAHVNQPVPPMRTVCSDGIVPDWLEQLVGCCLEKDPAARPSNMGEVLEILRTEGRTSASGLRKAARRAETKPSGAPSNAVSAESAVGSHLVLEPKRSMLKPAATLLGLAGLLAVSWLAIRAHRADPVAARPPASASETPVGTDAFDVLIDSMPSGATVQENGQTLGSTPLHVSVSNVSVRAEARMFILQLGGYQTYSVSQGPSDRSVTVRAALQPVVPPPPSASSPAPAPSPNTPTRRAHYPVAPPASAPEDAPPPPPHPHPLGIETTR